MVKDLQKLKGTPEDTLEKRLQIKLHYTGLENTFLKNNLNWLDRLEYLYKTLAEKLTYKKLSTFDPFIN